MGFTIDAKPTRAALMRRAAAAGDAGTSGRDMASRWNTNAIHQLTRAGIYDKFVEIERLALEIIEEIAK